MEPKHNFTNQQSEMEMNAFFEKAEIPYFQSKEAVWEAIESELTQIQKPASSHFSPRLFLALAASVLILAGIYSFLRFYNQTIISPAGQLITANLPDGSVVEMNANSTLTYRPFWFFFSRNIQFEGEGFFQVEKGKLFAVESKQGKTFVLGTSFNIFSREEAYNVHCLTGSVKVVSSINDEVILKPGYKASIDNGGKINVKRVTETEAKPGWTENMFNFTATDFSEVIAEIERQYDVEVNIDSIPELNYTGYFSRNKTIDEVLILVGKPFGLKFVKTSEKNYRVTQN